MADLRAFRGFRYDLGRAGALSDLVAPPYDVVDAALQQKLYDRSPYNAIRLELTRDEPSDTEGNNRYSRASRTLSEWVEQGVLQQDSLRSLYVCEQEYTVEGVTHRRRGFFARVRLEPFGTGRIFPHEETLSGPKEDRLKLFRATGMNLSPVFGLYPDESNEVFAPFEATMYRTLPTEATDHLGVTSRLWAVHDEKLLGQVIARMDQKPIFIADGHHRYETGLKYLEEQKAAGKVLNDESAPNFVLMMLVSMSDPGLLILPTHRLVSGLPALTSPQLRSALEPAFSLEVTGTGTEAAHSTWETIQLDGSQSVLGLHTLADDTWHLARLLQPERMAAHEPDRSEEWRDLAVSVLHVLILNRLIPEAMGGTPKCRYVHLLGEVLDSIQKRECPLSVLVPPATMHHVESIAGNREKMPPKSTYFYPKLLTGLLFNSLKVN